MLTRSHAPTLADALTTDGARGDARPRRGERPSPPPSVLRRLSLGSNPIGDAGCDALASALLSSARLLSAADAERPSTRAKSLAILQLGENLSQAFLQFDPAPRTGGEVEPPKRAPDYFL